MNENNETHKHKIKKSDLSLFLNEHMDVSSLHSLDVNSLILSVSGCLKELDCIVRIAFGFIQASNLEVCLAINCCMSR